MKTIYAESSGHVVQEATEDAHKMNWKRRENIQHFARLVNSITVFDIVLEKVTGTSMSWSGC